MAPAEEEDARKAEELAALLNQVRDRVRARYPQTAAGPIDVALADLMPLLHARDAAEAKVAAIGTVNPRPGGLFNTLIQSAKRLLARTLDWHVREQVEFNRQTIACINAALEALNELNRALVDFGRRLAQMQAAHEQQARDTADIAAHWPTWRAEWEQKLARNETQFLRAAADLQGSFQHRVTLLETNFRELTRAQHADFTAALDRNTLEVQKRLWEDLERSRLEFERLIHAELRVLRARGRVGEGASGREVATPPLAQPPIPAFRGPEGYVRGKQEHYVPHFTNCRAVLDVGCGRGEFLELLREAGVPAQGVDADADSIAICREKALQVEQADLFAYLEAQPEAAFDGLFCAHVVEHLPPDRLPAFLALCAARLSRNGLLVIETPNPECLATLAVNFYLDPTHTRPIPQNLLRHYLQEAGFGGLKTQTLSPAIETYPSLSTLPPNFREAFFGGLDYSLTGRKL